jgi:hypothetical protein
VRGLDSCLEEPAGTTLRATPIAFHYVQLLLPQAAAGHGEEAGRLFEGSRWSANALPVFASRIRGDAGAHSPVDLGTEDGESLKGDAGSEAACSAVAATERPAAECESVAFVGRWAGSVATQFLAETLLRLQRVEQEEEDREVELHAYESGEARIGNRREDVGVEQLPVLSVWRKEFVHAGSGTEVKVRASKGLEQRQNPHPLPTPQRVRRP